MSSNVRKRAFRSSCACAKSRADPCSPFLHSVVSNDSVSGQGKPWSDCADAQADMGLRCPHMPEDKFPHGAAHAARHMSRNVRKRQFWHVGQTKIQISLRIRAVWSELRCSYEETLHLCMSKMCPVKILIRLCECAGWFESSLGAQVRRYVFWRCGLYWEIFYHTLHCVQ